MPLLTNPYESQVGPDRVEEEKSPLGTPADMRRIGAELVVGWEMVGPSINFNKSN